ncbi:MAG: hypothetical protein FLDDKLPJ_03478 [Phycisphaerae bacterium]|nr:hypothetical protein [Phycisphaerae bacterium]
MLGRIVIRFLRGYSAGGVAVAWRTFVVIAASPVLSEVVHGQEPVPVTKFENVQPTRYCGVKRLADGSVIQTTAWIESSGNTVAGDMDLDCFDATTCSEPTDCESCVYWTIGGGYCNTFAVADMTVESGCEGGLADTVSYLWVWGCQDGRPSTCFIAVFTGPTFPSECSDQVGYDLDEGFVSEYPQLPCGRFRTTLDLEDQVDLTLYPGVAAYGIFIAREYDGVNLVPAYSAEPVLWSANGLTGGVERAGSNGPLQYDDTNCDGVHDPGECRRYDDGRCPDPLTAAVAFGSDTPGECTGEEAIRKARCRSGGKVVVKVIRGVVGEAFQVRLDTGEEAEGEFNSRSKGKAKFNGVSSGRNAATATFACGDTDVRVFDCP